MILRSTLALAVLAACGAQPPPGPSASASTPVGVVPPQPMSSVGVHAVEPAGPSSGSAREPSAVDPPDPFPDRTHVTVAELVAALDDIARELESAPAVVRDYEVFLAAHDLPDSPELLHDYVRVKLVFEATRDGGWWHLRWKVTNEQPNSEKIWSQWADAEVPASDDPVRPTAVAECDELSALFAFVVRKLGVRRVGLFWPVWNHVVAVWTIPTTGDRSVRIVVPTSQIFLGEDESLGTDGFDPYRQKTIYAYGRRDVKPQHRIAAPLARFFVSQARTLGGSSQAQQQQRRNARSTALGGS